MLVNNQGRQSIKTNLLLDSIEIQGFRLFRHLKIDYLGRVNLIVGKNNAGKSALLEALRLYAHRGSPLLIWELLQARDEIGRFPGDSTNAEEQALSIRNLFSGRTDVREHGGSIQIGPSQSRNKTLAITVDWYAEDSDEEGNQQWHLLASKDLSTVDNARLRLATRIGQHPRLSYPLDPNMSPSMWLRRFDRPEFREIPNTYISANGLDKRVISRIWDKTALTDGEQVIIDALHILAPTVERLSMVGDEQHPYERIPIAKIEQFATPVPLRSMGEGMTRMFEIALALVNVKDGMLLVDEIERGLHYSVQPDIWRLIFQIAHALNIQVFATSHSWDCIDAFQEAAQADKAEQAVLIRLTAKKNEVTATLFNEQELTVATRNEIEVR